MAGSIQLGVGKGARGAKAPLKPGFPRHSFGPALLLGKPSSRLAVGKTKREGTSAFLAGAKEVRTRQEEGKGRRAARQREPRDGNPGGISRRRKRRGFGEGGGLTWPF